MACNAFSVKCTECGAWSHGDCVETEAERAALKAGAEEGREFSWRCSKCPIPPLTSIQESSNN